VGDNKGKEENLFWEGGTMKLIKAGPKVDSPWSQDIPSWVRGSRKKNFEVWGGGGITKSIV